MKSLKQLAEAKQQQIERVECQASVEQRGDKEQQQQATSVEQASREDRVAKEQQRQAEAVKGSPAEQRGDEEQQHGFAVEGDVRKAIVTELLCHSQTHTSITTLIKLPFVATSLPCALPTITEIEQSKDVLQDYFKSKVVRVGKQFVVKYGLDVNIIEGENMLFVQSMTAIPIPKLYAIYIESNTKKTYIIMENIDGETLTSGWPSLTETQKQSIVAQLRSYYEELRRLPSPNYFGGLGQRRFQDEFFRTVESTPSINGPFENEDEFNEAMTLKYVHEGRSTYRANYYRQAFSQIFKGHQPTFTHADCQRKNIMISKIHHENHNSNAETHLEDEYKVTIIDWETAGWYPSYWEYCVALLGVGEWNDDWGLFISKILNPYHCEAPWLDLLLREIWF